MIASVDITGIKYEVSKKTEKYVLEKIGKLDRFVPIGARGSMAADIKLKEINEDHGNKYEAEVIVHVPNKIITAKDSTMNMMAAVDIVEAKLVAQLRKYKDSVIGQKIETRS